MNGNVRRREIVDFVLRYINEHGVSPSLEDICSGIGTAKSTVHYHILKMRDGGILGFQDGRVRSIRLLQMFDEEAS